MSPQFTTEKRIFITLEYTKRKELEDLKKNLSLKIWTKLEIANFLLQFCKLSVCQSLLNSRIW